MRLKDMISTVTGLPSEAAATVIEPTASLGELFQEQYPRLVRLAHMLTGSNEVAEDLVQDCFAKLHTTNLARLDQPAAYLNRSVVNAARSWGRRRKLEVAQQWQTLPPHVSLAARELVDVLAQLPYKQRAAIVLRFYEDRSEAEIAEILDCRPGTVGSLIHRGLAHLRKVLPQ
ncbi:MAG: SigE family RNA polymerase sigma factor [Acidimicrobiia bacterium]